MSYFLSYDRLLDRDISLVANPKNSAGVICTSHYNLYFERKSKNYC